VGDWSSDVCSSDLINIRIKGKNQQCQNTLRTANLYRINQEIKFLYAKKIETQRETTPATPKMRRRLEQCMASHH
jgi:hypothetical protein